MYHTSLPNFFGSIIKSALVLAAIGGINSSYAQHNKNTPKYGLVGTTAKPATSNKIPFNNTDTLFQRIQVMYRPAELKDLTSAAKAPSGNIGRVYLRTNATAATFSLKDVIIKLTQTSDTIFKAVSPTSPDVPFYTCTEVFNQKTYAVATPGWIEFDLATAFKYDNTKSLILEVSGDNGFTTQVTQQADFRTNYGKFNQPTGYFIGSMHEFGFDLTSASSVTDLGMISDIKVYPNPATGSVMITSTDNINGTLIVMDMNGRMLLQETIAARHHTFSVATLANGLYFYKIMNVDNIQITTGKLTVVH